MAPQGPNKRMRPNARGPFPQLVHPWTSEGRLLKRGEAMPIRGSPNAPLTPGGRHRSEWQWTPSIGTAGVNDFLESRGLLYCDIRGRAQDPRLGGRGLDNLAYKASPQVPAVLTPLTIAAARRWQDCSVNRH